ncbi:MAG: cation:proton antiporter [Alphaproteobacteria bacterium]
MHALMHLAIIWCSVYAAIFLAKKTKLTPVLYYLAMGTVLANFHILPHEPLEFIRDFAEFGIILIMFALGFEESTRNFVQSIKRSWGIAFFGALAPFTFAYLVADYFWNDTNMAVISGLAMTATAVSLTMVVLRSVGLHKTKAATGIMTSAILDDIASLVLVAILIPIATSTSEPTLASIGLIAGKAVLFFIAVIIIGIIIFPHKMPERYAKIPLLSKGAKDVFAFGEGEYTVLAVILMAVLGGILAHYFGFHPAIGAYMAGLILQEEYFHFDTEFGQEHFDKTKRIIDNVAFIWIGPVFFVVLGTQIPFDVDVLISVIPQIVILTSGLLLVQVSSAALSARYTGGFTFQESMLIGFGMLGRAELCFVVLDIAYIQTGLLTTELFFTLMATAFFMNIAVPVTILFWKPYFEGEKHLSIMKKK